MPDDIEPSQIKDLRVSDVNYEKNFMTFKFTAPGKLLFFLSSFEN
jgi:hypothetical protein